MSPFAAREFSLSDARQPIRDLFVPKPWIYWLDFGLTYIAGIYCFQRVRGGSMLVPHQGFQASPEQALFFVLSCLLFYRAAMFIHEVVHQRATGRLSIFRLVWNLVCGVPFLLPSFTYYTHIDHHRRQHFGTAQDGEYIALQRQPRWHALLFLASAFVIPVLAFLRFAFLTPLAWLIPGFRAVVHRHASSMVMDPTYIRPLPKRETLRVIYLQEALCFAWCMALLWFAPLVHNRLPIPFFIHAYATAVVIVLLNAVRTLGAHRWHNDGEEMSMVGQLLDSVNYPHHSWLSELWGPVGTRFHALHHLFPSLPYHALPQAHRRLMESLPADSPYRRTNEHSLTRALAKLWRAPRPPQGSPSPSGIRGVS